MLVFASVLLCLCFFALPVVFALLVLASIVHRARIHREEFEEDEYLDLLGRLFEQRALALARRKRPRQTPGRSFAA